MPVLVTLTVSSLALLAVAHMLALKFFLYWRFLWFDIPMHFLGGVCVALGFGILPFFRIKVRPEYSTFLTYLIVVLIVGLSWEVFEILGGINVVDEYFVSDTISDLCMDILGGTLGYFLVKRLERI